MPHFPKPFFRKDRGLWYVQLHGTQHNLGPHQDKAFKKYHELMTRPAAIQRKGLSIYVGVGGPDPVRVFALEHVGIDSLPTGCDSQFGTMPEIIALGKEQVGESPLTPGQSQTDIAPDRVQPP